MLPPTPIYSALLLLAAWAMPHVHARERGQLHHLTKRVDATNIACTDPNAGIDGHNKNVALLGICGGIAGSIQKCEGNPTSTTGQSGDAKFTLTPTDGGATINISKGRWEQCIKSAEAKCGVGSAYTATCPQGASTGNVNFELTKQ